MPDSHLEFIERFEIRVTGIVQGVGFRPFVYRLAMARNLCGWTLNDTNGVLIQVEGPVTAIRDFVVVLEAEAPPLAKIFSVECTLCTPLRLREETFVIRDSNHIGNNMALLPVDSHVCEECLVEFNDPTDRRYRYPFINCTNCGPRYSLIKAMPYDRANTTMSMFPMCENCSNEYHDPASRRYHAQPNACPICGPHVSLRDKSGLIAEREDAIALALAALAEGKIIAVKSLGGFHLVVDAANARAIVRLRKKKKRDSKPFALMVPSVHIAHKIAVVSPHESVLLSSHHRPIVLLRKKTNNPDLSVAATEIAPRNPSFGIMLPSAPLHYLLLTDPRMPVLVMTSGNSSGLPIAFRNADAREQLFGIYDLLLEHDRDIFTRVDDSVIRLVSHPELSEPIVSFLRKARGYAPYSVSMPHIFEPMVAYGAELKTTVSLASGERVYVSQHVGDLGNDETFQAHQDVVNHLSALYNIRPQAAVCDLHPNFRSTRLANQNHSKRIKKVQHHHAHMAACMVDNSLTGNAIGVIFDGSGFGVDSTIWGGEFLVGGLAAVERAAHLRPILLLGGDQAIREPIRSGFSLVLDALGEDAEAISRLPTLAALGENRRHVYKRMWGRRINVTSTSSMGRLFDGVAALIGICAIAEYEAQGPIEMEGLLARDLWLTTPYTLPLSLCESGLQLDHSVLIREIVSDLEDGIAPHEISRRFHSAVVAATVNVCVLLRERHHLNTVVLSGGVFLNEFLLANCIIELRRINFEAYCHNAVPTNDGGISVGQIAVANAMLAS